MIILTFLKTFREVWVEALELRAKAQKRYRFMDY